MAQATQTAPLKKQNGNLEQSYLDTRYDTDKKYLFELADRNMERENPVFNVTNKRIEPHKQFKPLQNLVLTSQIVWNGSRTIIRYYDGCESLFISEQPKEKDVIEQLQKQTARREFRNGIMSVDGYDTMLLLYCNICSWNSESPFRTKSANMVFIPLNADKKANEESDVLDKQELALQYAKEATDTKMLIHANFLGIPTIDWMSDNHLTPKQIRTEYRKRALSDYENFISSYGNKAIESKYYIDKALTTGLISNRFNPNIATWKDSNREICDISGLKSQESIAEKLLEFSQLETGEEFLIQLKAIYKD